MDKPNASLSAERRGTLSYPDLCSFLYEEKNEKFNRNKITACRKKGEASSNFGVSLD